MLQWKLVHLPITFPRRLQRVARVGTFEIVQGYKVTRPEYQEHTKEVKFGTCLFDWGRSSRKWRELNAWLV